MDAIEAKLLELLDSILEGSATDPLRKEFARLVHEHSELTPLIAKQLRMHNLLQWQSEENKLQYLHLHYHGKGKKHFSPSGIIPKIVHFAELRWKWTAAAVVLLAIGIFAWSHSRQQALAGGVVADVVNTSSAKWAATSTALVNDGHKVGIGRLEMKCGSFTLHFRSGATLSASGDVSMRIESDMLVYLESGQATARVPEQAHGFTIRTLDAEVVDLGTEFGVMARKTGTTDVVVFEGKVDLKPVATPDTSQVRLTQGEGARVDRLGAISRIVEVHRNPAGSRWSTDRPANDSLIKAVTDNVLPEEDAKFYEIVPGGLAEDVKAYVDRPHEWNGLTPDGLPAFLNGADYVRTFNDYRYLSELEIQVQLARPATVYIFFDHRVPPPDWLKEQFENTGVDIGLDEGPSEGEPTRAVAVGAGKSIDNIFRVWRRVCPQPEKLMFGPMGNKSGARAMYGIAATSLD